MVDQGCGCGPQQLEYLPDGIRHCTAPHCLLEVKVSEQVNAFAFQQVLGYDFFYPRGKRLKPSKVQSFLLGSQTPAGDLLERLLYRETEHRCLYLLSRGAGAYYFYRP